MLRRAYSILDIKSVDADQRIITGIATSATVDRMGDVVEPGGAEFDLPIPLLWQHDSKQPIGHVFEAKATPQGIEIKARVAQTDTPGPLKDRLDLAWQSMVLRLVRGLSIGFQSIEESYNKETGGFHFLKWLWLELSAVTIPANADASIQTIKSCDVGLKPTRSPRPDLAATGTKSASASSSPGASGLSRVVTMRTDRTMKKTYAEQIATWENTRAAKSARQQEIQSKASDEGRAKDEAEAEEFETLDREIESIDKELADVRKLEEREKRAAKPVTGTAERRHDGLIRVAEPELPKGIAFARYVGCKMMSFLEMRSGNFMSALDIAKERYPSHTALHAAFQTKGAVAAGSTSASNWADDLVPYQAIASDFLDYLRPMTIIDRIQGFDRVPFNVRVGGFSAGTTGYWKGEGKPIPVSKATSTNVTLTWATVGGLVILTDELVRFSTPSAEQKIRQDIARAVTARMDIDFVDPAKAAVANTSPASITYGIAATAPTGTTAAKFRADIANMLGDFATANLNGDVTLIMSKSMATQLALMMNTLGQQEFPELTPSGGTLIGMPVLVSEHLTSVGSPSTQSIIACIPSEIMLADDGVVTVDASSEASIEMLDSSLLQNGMDGTGASLVNLWQNGLLGLRAERVVNWKLRRAAAVGYISPAAYIVQ